MAATDLRRAEHFRWHNSGLTNKPHTEESIRLSFCIEKS